MRRRMGRRRRMPGAATGNDSGLLLLAANGRTTPGKATPPTLRGERPATKLWRRSSRGKKTTEKNFDRDCPTETWARRKHQRATEIS